MVKTEELKILQRKTPLQKELELYVFLDGALLNLNDCDPIIGARSQAAYEEEERMRAMWDGFLEMPPVNWDNLDRTMIVFPLYPKE